MGSLARDSIWGCDRYGARRAGLRWRPAYVTKLLILDESVDFFSSRSEDLTVDEAPPLPTPATDTLSSLARELESPDGAEDEELENADEELGIQVGFSPVSLSIAIHGFCYRTTTTLSMILPRMSLRTTRRKRKTQGKKTRTT